MDTSIIIGVIAILLAYLSLIPSYKKLDLPIKLNKLDIKIILYLVSFATLSIVFFKPLNIILYFPDIIPKKYGFDNNNFVLLMIIIALIYTSFRIKNSPFSKKNVKELSDLFENLFYNKNYADLTFLLEKHINTLVELKNSQSLRNKIANKIRSKPVIEKHDYHLSIQTKEDTKLIKLLQHDEPHHDLIYNLFNRLLTSEEYVKYLANTKPYFCLDIISYNLNRDFLDIFIISIMRDKHSIYYYELNNSFDSYNTGGKLLNYFFTDIKVAEKLAVYRPIGEEVIYQLENNQQLIAKYNQESKQYYNSEKNNCPIYISLQFFNLMILNAMHQGIQWHMWLYYFNHFIKKIIAQIKSCGDIDYSAEFSTPFHYLIYEIVSILFNWLTEYTTIKNKEAIIFKSDNLIHENGSIIKSIIFELDNVIFSIISTDKLNDRFKISTIETLVYFIRNNQNIDDYNNIISLIIKAVVYKPRYHQEKRISFLKELQSLYQEIDLVIRIQIKNEDFKLDKQIDKILQEKAKI